MAPSMEILPVEEVDIPELCRLELEARDHNPNWRFPEQTSWTKEAKLEFKIRGFRYIYSRSTSVYLKCCIRNEIAGFVGWDDPDYLIKRVPDQTHTREEVMKGADKTFWNTMREAHQAAEAEAPAKYWYLSNLVTARSHQGQGVGSALLEWGVRRADAANLPIFCLSSPQGYLLYARRGFEVTRWCTFVTSAGEQIQERALIRWPRGIPKEKVAVAETSSA